ncbi:MAG: metal-dependent transcriptional regulator [Candidatus Helarchaeota archaeon]
MAAINLSRKKEDYVKAISNLIDKQGYARIKDIAEELNIKPPSVSEMLKKLQKDEIVNYRKNHPITLTQKGEKIAQQITEEYEILTTLLVNLLVPENIALEDACNMEHNLHEETVTQLKKFVGFIKDFPDTPKWLVHFKEFCSTGNFECKEKKIK